MEPQIVLAPIKGYTDPLWRCCYFDHFKGLDKVVTPFLLLSEHNQAKPDYFTKFLPEIEQGINVVPQYLVKTPEPILYSSKIMADMGVKEFNLNMGCPAPAIYKKGRGSGLMENLDSVKGILDEVVGKINGDFTVKIRVGITDSSLVGPVVELFNQYPLKEVIVHPRSARQLYSGTPDINAFKYVYDNSKNPVSYNGDICTLDDYNSLKNRFPNVSSWMIGRGVLQDPTLPESIKTGNQLCKEERDSAILKFIYDFKSRVENAYYKESIAFSRVKATMIYIAKSYTKDPERITAIKRSESLDQMLEIISLN